MEYRLENRGKGKRRLEKAGWQYPFLPSDRRKEAFTLMELLVAICVLSILISLLLAGLRSAKESANRGVCVAHLRQLGQVFANYLNDNNNTYPVAYDRPGGWPKLFYDEAYVSDWKLFRCPSNKSNPNEYDATVSHYGYNYIHIGLSYRLPGPPTYSPARVTQIERPAETVLLVENLLGDKTRSSYIVADSWTPSGPEYGNPEPWHSGAFNVLWCDGHVSSIACPDRQRAYDDDILGKYSSPSSKWKLQ